MDERTTMGATGNPVKDISRKRMEGLDLTRVDTKIHVQLPLALQLGIGSPANWEEVHKDGTSTTHVHGELLEYNPYDCLRFKIFHHRKILNGYVSELRFIL